jgi:hypothetical protein
MKNSLKLHLLYCICIIWRRTDRKLVKDLTKYAMVERQCCSKWENVLFHPVSNFNTLRHQFESGKTQKTAGRRISVAIGNTKVTIAITIIQF